LIHTGEIDPDVEKKKAEESEAKKDVFFLLLAVIGTLLVISALMVRLCPSSTPYLLTCSRLEQPTWQELASTLPLTRSRKANSSPSSTRAVKKHNPSSINMITGSCNLVSLFPFCASLYHNLNVSAKVEAAFFQNDLLGWIASDVY